MAKKVAKKARNTTRVKQDGIPRTAAAARRLGFNKVDVDLSRLSANEMAKWIPISATSAKRGHLAMVRPPSAGRPPFQVSPGDRDGFYIVCYYDSDTKNYDLNCHEVPASQIDMLARRRH